jgi:hypothetical protein
VSESVSSSLPVKPQPAFKEPIFIVLLLGLILGVLITTQYGESWDELQFYKYADRALEAYSTWPTTGQIALTGNTYDNYGPAYVIIVALGARLLGLVIPWITSDLRHLVYLLTYLVGVWAFYALCRRWLARGPALGACLLLATQPLFWGHAFISPKDIPFLTFFVLSLLLGFRMVDAVQPVSPEPVQPRSRRLLLILTGLWLVMLFGLLLATPLVHAWIENLVTAAAAGQSNIISRIASDIHSVKPAVYVQRYFVLFVDAQIGFLVLSSLLMAFVWSRAPTGLRFVLTIAPAAIALGVTTSIRVLGPFAALMVAAYALWKLRLRAVPVLAAYVAIGALAMYLTWPYLWPDPIGHFVESVRVMAEYPWRGLVLFNGVMYASTDIPRSYLPVLLGIQLTEPVWFLFAAGLGIAIYDAVRKPGSTRGLLLLTLVWFVLPLAGFIVTRSPLYDNFRQVIFILPPVFMLAGVAFSRIRRPLLQAALIALVILPGLVDGARLHPYEYAYYNRFIGGELGAFRKYELDYWGTSYRAAADYLNSTAPANASVWVEGPAHLMQLYARPDLKVYSTYEVERAPHYDYVVALTRFNLDQQSYPQARVVYTIGRDQALFTVVKQP